MLYIFFNVCSQQNDIRLTSRQASKHASKQHTDTHTHAHTHARTHAPTRPPSRSHALARVHLLKLWIFSRAVPQTGSRSVKFNSVQFCSQRYLQNITDRELLLHCRCRTVLTVTLTFTLWTLQYMHTHSPVVLHRDLKPQNIYVTGEGDVRLGDLGLARKLAGPTDMATTQVGTIVYLSPEIISGQPYNSKVGLARIRIITCAASLKGVPALHLRTYWAEIQTPKGSKERWFIMTRTYHTHIFGEIPFVKPQNDT